MKFDAVISPAEIQNQTFNLKRRGFDRQQVQAYLAEVADQLEDAQRREADMRSRMAQAIRRAEAAEEKARANASAPADELEAAQAEGKQHIAAAQAEAATLVDTAQAEAATLMADRRAEGHAAAQEMVDQARVEADEIVTQGRIEAQRVKLSATHQLQQACDNSDALVREAQEARGQILEDMDRRRRHARAQVERLRVGRDRLLRSYDAVRRTLDETTDELKGSLKQAKLRGDNAAREVSAEQPATRAQLEAELLDAKLIGRVTTTEHKSSVPVRRSPALPRLLDLTEPVANEAQTGWPKAPAAAPVLSPTPPGAVAEQDPIAAMMQAVEAKHGKPEPSYTEEPLDPELAQLADDDLDVVEPSDEIENVQPLPASDSPSQASDLSKARKSHQVPTELMAQRDAVIADATKQLEKKLTLALAQEQSELLAGLDSANQPDLELTSLVGDFDRQVNRYVAAINEVAASTYGAGAALIGNNATDGLLPAGAVEELLANDVVMPIREQLESLNSDDRSAATTPVDQVRDLYLTRTVDHVGFAASRLANLLCVAGVCDALPEDAEVPWKTPAK